MANKFLILLGKLLNWLPLLHVSSDSDFGSFDGKKPDFRISLFSISMGQFKYYLLSIIKKDNKYSWKTYTQLNLEKVCAIKSVQQLESKSSEYFSLISDYKGDTKEIEDKINYNIDLLKTKISEDERRVTSSLTKLNNYRALLSAMLAGGIYLLSQNFILGENNYFSYLSYLLLFLFSLYSLSSFSQITYGLKVKGYVKSSFSDLKKSPTQFKLAESYYIDFLSLKDESQIAVTITKNAEKYLKRSFIALIFACLFILLNYGNLLTNQLPEEKIDIGEFVIIDSNNQRHIEQLSRFFKKLNSYQGTIYIISNKSTGDVKKLSGFIETYLIEKQELKTVILKSETLKDNVVLLKFGD